MTNPIDMIEETVISEDWPYHRVNAEELIAEVDGRWCDYRVQFNWQSETRILQLCCIMDMRVQPQQMAPVYELLALINQRLALGHFEIDPDESVPLLRYALLLTGDRGPRVEALEELVEIAVGESERFYPAFQFVIWGGKSPKEAASFAMLDTVGEA